jgi:D-glycero-alpha-D-manno-heptose-7-phosphate kinase
MIIVKTPYRISLFGGGTDFPQWYNKKKGKVISGSINHFSYIQLKKLPKIFNYKYRIRYFLREEVVNEEEIKHPVIREAIKLFKINKLNDGLDITHSGDLHAQSGIGSSSSFTVGLLHALNEYLNIKISKKKLAELSIDFEQKVLKEYVGSQDQVIASYGGLRIINFEKKGFKCTKLKLSGQKMNILEKSLQFFYTGIQRNSQKLEKKKILSIQSKQEYYNQIYNIASEAQKIFMRRDNDKLIHKIGNLLNKQWMIKKKLVKGVSNSKIDKMYAKAIKNGAIGGKLCGSGGGGFLVFMTPKKFQRKVSKNINLPEIKMKFTNEGSKIIFNNNKIVKNK